MPSTGLANRRALEEFVRSGKLLDGDGRATRILMIDIDHFKNNFNDSFGHQVEDQVLRLVAKVLQENVRGRSGGALWWRRADGGASAAAVDICTRSPNAFAAVFRRRA